MSDERHLPAVRSTSPGRLRLDVPIIRYQPTLAASVEDILSALPHVTHVKASAMTGSVLIIYGAKGDAESIRDQIGATLQSAAISTRAPRSATGALREILSCSLPPERRTCVRPVALTMLAQLNVIARDYIVGSAFNLIGRSRPRLARTSGPRAAQRPLQRLLLVALVLTISGQWLQRHRAMAWRRLRQETETRLRERIFVHVETLDLDYLARYGNGPLMSLMTDEVEHVGAIVEGTDSLIEAVMSITAAAVVFARTSRRVTLVAAAAIPIVALPARLLGRRVASAFARQAESNGRLMEVLDSTLAGIPEIKSFTTEAFEAQRVRDASQIVERRSIEALRVSTAQSTLTAGISQIAFLGVIRYGASLEASDSIDRDRLIQAVMWFQPLLQATRQILLLAERYYRAAAASVSLLKLLRATARYTGGTTRLDSAKMRGEIVFQDVTFGYDSTRPVLEHVSLRIPAGSTFGIVGPSGSGKSTLLALLLGFYYPDQGRILIDGDDIQELDFGDLRRAIAMVSQEIYLFDDTLEANARYGRRGASDDDVAAAMSITQLDATAARPGLWREATAGPRGARLSGGQRQRLAIARAIVKAAPIIVLDESTSQLDNNTESRMREMLRQATADQTVVLAAHRLSSVQHAGTIVVLDEGRIREHGTHTSLLAQRGLYYELWQSRG